MPSSWCTVIACLKCNVELGKKHKDPCKSQNKHYCDECVKKIYEGKDTCFGHGAVIGGYRYGGTKCYACINVAEDWIPRKKAIERNEKKRAERMRIKTLLELCAQAVARSPSAILYLSQTPLTEDFWEMIEKYVPSVLGKRYKEELLEAQQENGRAMYRVIGKSFGRFYARGATKSIDCKKQKI